MRVVCVGSTTREHGVQERCQRRLAFGSLAIATQAVAIANPGREVSAGCTTSVSELRARRSLAKSREVLTRLVGSGMTPHTGRCTQGWSRSADLLTGTSASTAAVLPRSGHTITPTRTRDLMRDAGSSALTSIVTSPDAAGVTSGSTSTFGSQGVTDRQGDVISNDLDGEPRPNAPGIHRGVD